jgi:hypothetical protein
MRKYTLGLALLALLAFAAVAANSASAAEWLAGGEKITSELATDSESVGNFTLEDMKLGSAVECAAKDTGTVGPGAKDKVSTVTLSGCKAVKGCSTVDTVTANNLPWTTSLVTEKEDEITSSGAGSPGYLVECTVAGILGDDLCTKATAKVHIENTASDVNALFNTEEEANCTLGGEKAGLVHGTELILLESGAALSAS